jgi:NAD(P)H-dependent flavin oxidoreductase YrpB (nitropropane dioxygenase family)
MKDITELLGVRYPIIQGALGVISNPEMVAAVSNAGGYGLLTTGSITNPEVLKRRIDTVKRLTKKPFGANLMAMHPKSLDFVEILVESGIKAVTTSAGSPKDLVPFLKQRGLKVLHVIANVEYAIKAEAAGVDAVIAEGSESGGLQGLSGVSTMVLVPLVADALRIPVVAAGGIGDSRGYRAAFTLGAKGVQLGTRFIASQECIAHSSCKNILCDAKETDTILIDRGRVRVRVLRTPLANKLSQSQRDQTFTSKLGSLEEAWIEGNLEANVLSSGQISGMIRKIQPVREIIEEMVNSS